MDITFMFNLFTTKINLVVKYFSARFHFRKFDFNSFLVQIQNGQFKWSIFNFHRKTVDPRSCPKYEPTCV